MIEVKRFKENPLVIPNNQIPWISSGTYNAGVIRNEGLFYMMIRGTGQSNQLHSNIGLAFSANGVDWNLLNKPVLDHLDYGDSTSMGIEDPRIVKWKGKFYIFATAYASSSDPNKVGNGRIGIWRTDDFIDYKYFRTIFDWEDKDACLIPRSYSIGTYLMHRKLNNIWLSWGKGLEPGITYWTNTRVLLEQSECYTDEDGNKPMRIGGNVVVPFNDDWLLLYHLRFPDKKYSFRYENSFMILDGENPRNIKYLHDGPILKPELQCELEGNVPNVCFNNAAVDMGDKYYLYWGAADTSTCGGILKKDDILKAIK